VRRRHGFLTPPEEWRRTGKEGRYRRDWRFRSFRSLVCQGTVILCLCLRDTFICANITSPVKALGCDKVVAISRSSAKKADAMKMGADHFIATGEDKDWAKNNASTLDLIVSTVSSPNMPLQEYLQLLRTNGQFIQVGAPEDPIPSINAFALIGKGVKIGGSAIGSPEQIMEMLELSAKKGVHPWIQKRPLKEANQTVRDMNGGKARYRYVLVNESHAKL